MPLLPLEPTLIGAETSICPANRHEWEAMIVMRPFRLYKITISRRAHIGGTRRCRMSQSRPITH